MTRTIKLLTALFAFGCGSGAAAAPDRGQWTGYGPGYYSNDQTSSQDDQATPPQPSPPQAPGEDQGLPPSSSQPPAQGGYQGNDSSQAQRQDQDEDTDDSAVRDNRQGRLGVLVMGLTPELRRFFGAPVDRGVLIGKVEPSSAAARAGIQVGDVLVRVGRSQVRSGDDVVQALAARQGERIRIAVIRQGHPLRLNATVPGRPSTSEENRL
jgi:hypothetical protein